MQHLTHLMRTVQTDKTTVMRSLQFGLCQAHSWTSLPKQTASDKQMCKFFVSTEKCWQRARWQGWNEHSLCYVPGVRWAAHTVDPGLNIYSLSCVHLCMCLCYWESQCGSESPAGVWGKKQQEAENPLRLWISVSKQEARHCATCACALS